MKIVQNAHNGVIFHNVWFSTSILHIDWLGLAIVLATFHLFETRIEKRNPGKFYITRQSNC